MMKNNKAFYGLLCFFFLFFHVTVSAFPKNQLIPGGVAILSVAPSHLPKPQVTYQSTPVAMIKGKTNWLAIIGISLKAKAGIHHIRITDSTHQTRNKSFRVRPHKYRTQYLTISNKNKVNPNKASMKRIEKEFFFKKKLKTHFSPESPQMNFIQPTTVRDSGRFGLRRVINKQKRNPHSGMDIAAPSGRTVKATEAGTILYTGNLFFTGNVIYLDHGNGLISLYAHLSKILVKKGQRVKRGQTIAKVGKTGRATGPHLHWSVYLNGNAINPAIFLAKKTTKKQAK